MFKIREARYCNIKLLLNFLVIYGHLIEPQINQNIIISVQYKIIYLFHMPAFVFLSGLFIRDCYSCVSQLKKTVPLYVVLQVIAFVCSGGKSGLISPYWILWYLISLSFWLGFAWCWLKFSKGNGRIAILIISIMVGCMIGYIDFIDYRLSLSRTLVFFLYFWLGVILNYKTEWKKYRMVSIMVLIIGILLVLTYREHLTARFLYHATPYGSIKNGAIVRIACYMIAVSVILFLLAWIPDKRFRFTKAGADTMPAYILHAPVTVLLRNLYLPWYVYLVVTIIFLWTICRVTQLIGTMYIIISSERRHVRHERAARSED